jgi:predicted amidohydrolase
VREPGSAAEEVVDLVQMLEGLEGRDAAIVGLLWTWLERHMRELGSLTEKGPAMRRRAIKAGPCFEVGAAEREALLADPPGAAAVLLARIELGLGAAPYAIAEEAQGFAGEPVLVFWRAAELARRVGRDEPPPSVQEHPSITTLAPSLCVCPKFEHHYGLHIPPLDRSEWNLAAALLERRMAGDGMPLSFHLATLGDHGLSEWWVDESEEVGALLDSGVEEREQADASVAFEEAISAAPAGGVLLLPELAATTKSLEVISAALAAAEDDAPALTVVGLYHDEPVGPPPSSRVATYVNEAVVLGPAGRELWRHRKLTYSEGEVEVAEGRTAEIVEDIALGDSVAVVPSPIGAIGVVICLDSFQADSRARLARSPIELFLVPSLSPSVHRHTDSLQQIVQALQALAFVCNRSPLPQGPGGTRWNEDKNRSFCAVQRFHLVEMGCRDAEATFILTVDG